MTTTPLCPDIDDMAVDRLWVQFHALTGLIRKLDSKLLDEIPRLDDRLEVLRIERRNQLALGAVLVDATVQDHRLDPTSTRSAGEMRCELI
jgi:hypothetical protein